MKYFTKRLWAGFNTKAYDDKTYETLSKRWNRNLRKYQEYMRSIEPKLSPQVKSFFSRVSLHDGALKSFSIGNSASPRGGAIAEFQIVISGRPDCLYTLKYRELGKCVVDYPSKSPLFIEIKDTFGDWGYDEFKLLHDGRIAHEILFSTGMTIYIEFNKFSFKKIKISRNVR